MLGSHPAIEIPQSTKYAEEMRKWEAHHSRFGAPGRPFVFRDYPKKLYKCERVEGKGIQIVGSYDVENDEQERNLNSRGFFELQKAHDLVEKEQTEHGILAAEREWQIQHGRLSEKAVAEVRAAEDAHGARHLPDVPETPIRRRGRKPKTTAVA